MSFRVLVLLKTILLCLDFLGRLGMLQEVATAIKVNEVLRREFLPACDDDLAKTVRDCADLNPKIRRNI